MRRIILPDAPPAEARGAAGESDVAAALVRAAFIIAYAAMAYVGGGTPLSERVVQTVLLAAAIFDVAILGSHLRRVPVPLLRPLALAVDLALVTSAVWSWDMWSPSHSAAGAWPVVYYLIITMAAIWYSRLGAIIVAVLSSLLYDWATHGVISHTIATEGHGPAFLLIGVTASYIVMARDRERERATQFEHDMSLARHLQKGMFPATIPEIIGLDISVCFHPARSVGGDLYELMAFGRRRLLLAVGDLAGKSVYGLFHLSLLHFCLHRAAHQALEPGELVEVINHDVYDHLQPDSFAALFVADINTALGTLNFANCGHSPPILVKAGAERRAIELMSGGVVIGVIRQPGYRQEQVAFDVGDVLVCATDGVLEARDRKGEEFGTERLLRIVREAEDAGAAALADRIMEAAERFGAGRDGDDRTVVVIRRVAEQASPQD